MNGMKTSNSNGERVDLNAGTWRISSFETATGQAAVELTIPGVAEFRMSPAAALALAARLASAAIGGQSFKLAGEVVSAPADIAVLGAFVETLLHDRAMAARAACGEQNPESA